MADTTLDKNDSIVPYIEESLSVCDELLLRTLNEIKQIEITELDAKFSSNLSIILSNVGHFVELSTLTYRFTVKHFHKKSSEVLTAHTQLLSTIKAIHQSHQNSDLIALQDLIKYELKDNLEQWKIKILPQIKNLSLK